MAGRCSPLAVLTMIDPAVVEHLRGRLFEFLDLFGFIGACTAVREEWMPADWADAAPAVRPRTKTMIIKRFIITHFWFINTNPAGVVQMGCRKGCPGPL